jgi:hypothetical protein
MAECKQYCSLRLPIKPQQLNNLEGKLKLPVTMELVNMRLKEIDPIHYIRPFLRFLVVPQLFWPKHTIICKAAIMCWMSKPKAQIHSAASYHSHWFVLLPGGHADPF